MYLFLCFVVSAFEIFTILECSLVPILQSITFSSEDCITGFKGVSSFEKILSKGTKPLGIKLLFSSMILWPTISFSATPAICSISSSCSWSIKELENSPVSSKKTFYLKIIFKKSPLLYIIRRRRFVPNFNRILQLCCFRNPEMCGC